MGAPQARLEAAIDRIRSGDRARGKQLLLDILKVDPQNDTAWFWMSRAVDEEELRRECLQEALKHNPRNAQAREALSELEGEPEPAAKPSALDRLEGWLARQQRYDPIGPGQLALIFALALGFLILALFSLRSDVLLFRESVRIQATVTDSRVTTEQRGRTAYWIKYAFRGGDGTVYTAGDTLGREDLWVELQEQEWNQAVSRGTVPVIYAASDPSINRLEDWAINPLLFVGGCLSFLFLLAGIFLMIYGRPTYEAMARQSRRASN